MRDLRLLITRTLLTGALLLPACVYAAPDAQQSSEAATQELPFDEDETGAAEPVSEETAANPQTGAIYIPLKPPFVVNYGGPGRLRFLKADITVRLQDAAAASSLRHHMPYVRNNLVMLFSAQSEESLHSQEGKELLRQEALAEVRNVLQQEDRQGGVVDLFFNTILVQQ